MWNKNWDYENTRSFILNRIRTLDNRTDNAETSIKFICEVLIEAGILIESNEPAEYKIGHDGKTYRVKKVK